MKKGNEEERRGRSSAEALIEATDDEFRHEMLHTHSVLCTYNTTEQSEEEKRI